MKPFMTSFKAKKNKTKRNSLFSNKVQKKKLEEMGEEQKEEEKKEEEAPPPEIVMKVDMHCEACARKVARSLKKFEGVEEVKADSRQKMVVVKGKTTDLDPMKICERVQKKTHKKVELISPLPKPAEEEEKKEEPPKEEAPPPTEEKKEEPKTIAVVLKIRLHCESCAQVLQKRIKKMEGIESVETDLPNDQIIVKGINIDPNVLVENVYKKTKRQAFIQEETKEEEKKEEEKKEEKKEEEEKKELLHEEEEELKKHQLWPSFYNNNNNHIQYAIPPYNAYNYPAYQPYQMPVVPYGPYGPGPVKPIVQYGSYGPGLADDQAFSDENPNACSVM